MMTEYKKTRNVVISKRLQTLAGMVTPGNTVADIGCDHGFLPIFLVQTGISPKVLAMDVRKGPLSGAKEHIAEYGLEEYIETRLSDGLKEYKLGEAKTCVCAGMGGPLMQKILTEGREKAESFTELILQPQSEIPEFRAFLRESGYEIQKEEILCEEGKYYFPMRVTFTGKKGTFDDKNGLYDRFGRELLETGNPVLKEYLEATLSINRQIERSLAENDSERTRERLAEVSGEIRYLLQALEMFEK